MYFKLSSLEGFRSALIDSVFSFFAVIVRVNREYQVKVEFKRYESVFYRRTYVFGIFSSLLVHGADLQDKTLAVLS